MVDLSTFIKRHSLSPVELETARSMKITKNLIKWFVQEQEKEENKVVILLYSLSFQIMLSRGDCCLTEAQGGQIHG